MWQGGDFPLELCWIQFGGERKKEGKRKKREKKKKIKRKKGGVRGSTFSLGSTEIGLSVFVGAGNKVR